MAKLSELKKVELLEAKVLSNDLEGVKTVLAEQSPIEFTARALGLACRFASSDMVKTLIDGGATLLFELTPTLKRKYDCTIFVNNNDDLPVNYIWYLFPNYMVNDYSNNIVDDSERVKSLDILYEKKMGDFSEVLYFAIFYNDDVIIEELRKLGIHELSEYRTDIVTGRVPRNRLNSFGRYDRREFQRALQEYSPDDLRNMLNNYMACIKAESITLFPTDLYMPSRNYFSMEGEIFVSKYCSRQLFDFFVQKTNMVEKVKKWDLILALIEQDNPSGIRYALKEKWISKPKEIDTLLKLIQEQKDVNPEMLGYVLEHQHKKKAATKNSKESGSHLAMDKQSLSASELKKIWGTRKQEDGTLIITSYKGEDKDVVIPSMIGKTEVTAVSSEVFDIEAPKLNEVQRKTRAEINSVVFPSSIREIPENIFREGYHFGGRTLLKSVILCDGVAKICDGAFSGCSGIEEIDIPNSVTAVGRSAFSGCSNLKSINLPNTLTEISDYLFSGCSALKSFVFPDSITYIRNFAFSDSGLEKLEIPDHIRAVGDGAFLACRALESLNISNQTSIGKSAFNGCNALADEQGRIIINGSLYGVADSRGSWILSPDAMIKPVFIGENIKSIAVPLENLPEIVYREHTEESKNIDIDSLAVGEEVLFGRFPNDEDCIMRAIRWIVLAKENGMALLMTADEIIGLHRELKQTGFWADSYIRTMLNDGFINIAFTEQERDQIVEVTVHTPKNKASKTDGGPDTSDRVFLLSVEEVNQYLPENESRKSGPTAYADKQQDRQNGDGKWMLRTPGKNAWGSVSIYDRTGICGEMIGTNDGRLFIRPAMWVKNLGSIR